ncbi:hypothetical protein MTY66_54770 [Mycolicibacterium sp. TY66]|nr:hypothetical protein MTY66_54770 [Mycolicibacterium sp. TY66]
MIVVKTLWHNALRRSTGYVNGSTNSTPAAEPKPGSLHRTKACTALAKWLDTQHGLLAELARDELADVMRLTEAINTLAARIGERVQKIAPTLLTVPGCGELTAAKIIAETAGISRFRSEAAFSRHNGTAPIPVWSGNTAGRVRLNRSGNRQLNAALHRIAITQLRIPGSAGQQYYRGRIADGKATKEALRCLKRHLSRTVYRSLHTDLHLNRSHQKPETALAA